MSHTACTSTKNETSVDLIPPPRSLSSPEKSSISRGKKQNNNNHQGVKVGAGASKKAAPRCTIALYNFGSPKVGNRPFAHLINRLVPNSFRVKCDGDIVTEMPLSGYKHVGTEIVVDGKGCGSIIIDPSFVEKWLRPTKRGISVHFLDKYKQALEGILRVHNALASMGTLSNGTSKRRSTHAVLDEKIIEYRRMVSGRLALEDGIVGDEKVPVEKSMGHAGNDATEKMNKGDHMRRKDGEDEADEHEQESAESSAPNFRIPMLSYALSQTYNILLLRFNRKAQQTQMEAATEANNVPLRE